MNGDCPYFDTSAFAKWYIREAASDEVESFIRGLDALSISRLVVLEFRCLVGRRRRARLIDSRIEESLIRAFEDDLRNGLFDVHPLADQHASGAVELIRRVGDLPLRTLDALHLAVASDRGALKFVTADRIQGDAAAALGFEVVRFH